MAEDSKLLEPLSTVVSFVLRLLIGILVFGFVLSLFDSNMHVGYGNPCVNADWISGSATDTDAAFNAKSGAHVSAIPQYCASHPSTYQNVLATLGELPSFILLIGGLFVLNSLLRAAARDGVYTPQTSSRLRLLGWWLLLGSLAAELIEATAKTALLATLTTEFSAGGWLGMWATPYLAVLTALGLITFARIMRVGVTMREDLAGTV
ncbi:DUF2975 domain-containing protein [Streptomyces colonosanans]|uniref:DUF2975 domain-containing protein n=1 Tax=Streptomyces colonosanans TaxID=1428652 RepID=A0A1S2P5F8_9ACTN|nr:DUF2975 domain-containing protein [Streptomyces colonosanans]OIJ88928.1 hypothetical protein BIV24_21045 [Streptomyces colonosanans]